MDSKRRTEQLEQYIQALETGDIIVISTILEQAELDRELENMMIAHHRKLSLLDSFSEASNNLKALPQVSPPRPTSKVAISFVATSIIVILIGTLLIANLVGNAPNHATPDTQVPLSITMNQTDNECDPRLAGDDNEIILYFDENPNSRLYQTLDRPIIILGVRDEEHYDILWDFVVAYIHQDEIEINDCETFPITVNPLDLQAEATATLEPACEAVLANDNRITIYATLQGNENLGKTVFDVEIPFVITDFYGALNQLLRIEIDNFTGYIVAEEVDLAGCAELPIRVSPLQ